MEHLDLVSNTFLKKRKKKKIWSYWVRDYTEMSLDLNIKKFKKEC